MKDILIGIVVTICVAIVVSLIRLGSSYLTQWMECKKQEALASANQASAAAWEKAIRVIDTITTATVSAIEQDVAKDLRVAVKDGTASREDLIKLSQDAYDTILQQAGPDIMEVLNDNIQDSEGFIRNRIEQAVYEVKR
ncbi:MAG: hypothetical protein IJ079_03815 [Lachnospiraceae bacterium]|nr:hypothetical protein [Lachnospiraceae bacterium]MBR1567535.1 hypothetical protein [Lachnospiraceae bacterium]MBR1568691.1 hypothetical protein [Lachnospiraceae bacterium]